MKRNIIREAVAVSIEGLPGEAAEWVALNPTAMRKHALSFVRDFAKNRGVILTDRDIKTELDAIVEELRSGKPLTGKVS